MAVTIASFKERFPEFTTADDALLTGTLAALEPRASLNEADKDELQQLRAADFLARSPFARDLKLVNDDGSTVYSKPLDTLSKRLSWHRRYA